MLTLRKMDVVILLSAGLFLATLLLNSPYVGTSVLKPVLDHPPVAIVQEVKAPQLRNNERIYQASLNWADYTEVTQPKVVASQLTNNERIYQASLNWADYTEVAQPKVASPQSRDDERIRQVSMNWADYVEAAEPKVTSSHWRDDEYIWQVSLNWADYIQGIEIGSPASSAEITRIGKPY